MSLGLPELNYNQWNNWKPDSANNQESKVTYQSKHQVAIADLTQWKEKFSKLVKCQWKANFHSQWGRRL